jgi:hypothetical protein
MKKLFILAAAAVVALAACTKTEVVNNTPDQAIAFQVANYVNATKADSHGHTSLLDEGFNNFKTYAWYTPATGTANQAFMAPATVSYDATKKLWHATDRSYFWPKTGFINFFSFAGNHLPDAVALDAADENKAKAHYTSAITVATDDNILIADGAYGFYSNPDAAHGLNEVTKGVPTLFRHMLSRVKFDISVDATEITDTKNNWEVVVNSAVVSYRNQGKLEVAFPAAAAITFDADGHPTTAGTTAKYASEVWNPESVANAELNKVTGTVTTNANGGSKSTPVELIADSVVMPQDLATTSVTFAINYTITHTYNGANPIVETVPISAKALTAFATPVTAWDVNTIYTYHIIIKPNGEILFDPAVEEWVEENTEPSYTIL